MNGLILCNADATSRFITFFHLAFKKYFLTSLSFSYFDHYHHLFCVLIRSWWQAVRFSGGIEHLIIFNTTTRQDFTTLSDYFVLYS